MGTKIDAISFLRAPSSTVSGASVVSKILVLASANTYMGMVNSWSGYGATTPYSTSSSEISVVGLKNNWYIVDGVAHTSGTLMRLDAVTTAWSRIPTGSAGQAPAQARLVSTFRNRLVVGRTLADPHNLFFSEVDNHTSFDYTNVTEIGAFALNEPNMPGRIGDEVTCFAAVNKDYAVIGCQDSVWQMRGDPKAGGSVDNVAWGGGIIGQFAWARDHTGLFYYLSRTDLMVMAEGSLPKSISEGRIQKFLSDIDFSIVTPRLVWDQRKKGLWIFFTPSTQRPTTALFWDSRLNGFEKHQWPSLMGPTAAHSLVGDTYQDQQILLGTWDGFLWTFDAAWTTDNGTAINSYVRFTPTALAESGERAILKETELVFGNHDFSGATVAWRVGDNAQQAVTSTSNSFSASTMETGRFMRRSSVRGNSATLRISNSALGRTWALEQAHIVIQPDAGRIR
jgi:hypothetical protein